MREGERHLDYRVWWRWLLVATYAGGIFALSAIPGQALPAVRINDKLIHAAEFGLWAVLMCRALQAYLPTQPHYLIVAISTLAAVLYGILDEVHQLMVAQRTTELADVAADGLGALMAGWCWLKAGARWPWVL
jgi:VanZ family protein